MRPVRIGTTVIRKERKEKDNSTFVSGLKMKKIRNAGNAGDDRRRIASMIRITVYKSLLIWM